MYYCKKYKPNNTMHHHSPTGNCEGCVYFSTANCGTHSGSASVETTTIGL